ncbi:helix-turn-helix domain-containing protein [Micromonospora sp. NPDC047620]|uniref:helix-turn-helix domain-containing protein n=1 Tax=Micromonospora sp. NPDC047620 TaxID=3364251 RepID=UPI0037142874
MVSAGSGRVADSSQGSPFHCRPDGDHLLGKRILLIERLVLDNFQCFGPGLHKAGEHTSAELAELFGVARSTVYRALERAATAGTAAAR